MNIRKILGLCEHDWVEVDRGKLLRQGSGRFVGLYFTYQCNKCKKLKEERSV